MPLQTDLNVSPYFDDYNEEKDYYKILFRPGVSVQARELNQLQTMLQKQVERFGDNIFKRGTIVHGCEITFVDSYPYIKIKDNEVDGTPVNVSQYDGYRVRNQANLTPLVAEIQTVVDGFESQNPDLKTLYLRYLNAGAANVGGTRVEQSTFAPDEILTLYSANDIIEKVKSYNDSAGFSNTDNIIFTSAIAIQNSSGGTSFANNFYVNDYISDGTANLQIVAVDTTTNTQAVILRLKPRSIDLQSGNADLWTLYTNTNIISSNSAPSDTANVVAILGSGATAVLRTGALGEVDSVTITNKGSGYVVPPYVSISSSTASSGQIAAANLVAQNYLTNITVANSVVSAVGNGYAMTVDTGVVYQKGYFSRVNGHLVLVSKYSTTPDEISVGFDTSESVINSNQDESLLDNATGAPNATAPGANRLKLTPLLVSIPSSEAAANSNFLPIVQFSNGKPYRQTNSSTVYNVIGQEIARRASETNGDYVVDPFLINTKAPNTFTSEATSFNIVVDPGTGYVNGNRVATVENYEKSIPKGTDTIVSAGANISINYGNYVRVSELGGVFLFKTGDLVTLYPTAKGFVTNTPGGTPSSSGLGTALGTARIRSLVHESGVQGAPNAVYRLYLFDIRLDPGKNFSQARSIFYNGSSKGIADTVLEGGVAVLKDSNLNGLMFYAGRPAVKTANNLSYIYRTINSTDYSVAANGILTFSVTGGETFPYAGVLSTTQEKDLVIVPLANAEASDALTGSISCNTTSAQVNGSSTSFTSQVQAGDFLKIGTSVIGQVNNVANNTVLFLTANASAALSANTFKLYFPQNVPISLDRSTRTANVTATSNTMTINLGLNINVATSVAVAYNVRSSNTVPVAKSVNRNRYVRLYLANNAGGTTGPWSLGVNDVFRLSKVYKGPNATFIDTDTTNVYDITNEFLVDHNQKEDYYDTSFLRKGQGTATTLTSSDYLLVKLDHFTDASEGLKGPGQSGTYNINDAQPLSNSATTINTLEIPEVYSPKGVYYDLRDQFDFRPQVANTVAANSNPANAPLNPPLPSNATKFSSVDKKFPAPDSLLTGTIEYYVGRTDRVTIDHNGDFHIISGTPNSNVVPAAPDNALTINLINIPPYPSVPNVKSAQTVAFADSRVSNERYHGKRLTDYTISLPVMADRVQDMQPRSYTMSDINSLEKRISDLEYYTSFTLTEAMVQKRVIPGSANNAMDRFKFGFFVDAFNNYNFADTTNPDYNASIVDGFLSPRVNEINLRLFTPTRTTPTVSNEDVAFIGQPIGTAPREVPVYVAPTPVAPTPVAPTPVAPTPVAPTPVANTSTGTKITVQQIIGGIFTVGEQGYMDGGWGTIRNTPQWSTYYDPTLGKTSLFGEGSHTFVAAEEAYEFTVGGLRYGSSYTAQLDGVDVTANIKQYGRLRGQGIRTLDTNVRVGDDINGYRYLLAGSIYCLLYFKPTIAPDSATALAASTAERPVGKKVLRILNSSGDVVASGVFNFPYYTSDRETSGYISSLSLIAQRV